MKKNLILFLVIVIILCSLYNNIESYVNLEYWEIHDPNFLKFANLKYFNKEIKKYSLKEENIFLADILINSPNNSVFLDIGAYNGDTSLDVAKILKENNRNDIKIIAFEPKKELCNLINEKAKQKKYNLECINIVISNKKGIIYNKKEEGPANMFNIKFGGNKYNSDTLDNILNTLNITNVYLMKIDVEGHEKELLEGSNKILNNTKHIYIELWNDNHAKERNPFINSSHNKNILKLLTDFYPIQKIEKNIYFKKK